MSAPLNTASSPIGTVYGVLLNDSATQQRMVTEFREAPYRAPPIAPVLYIKPRNTYRREGAAVAVPAQPGPVRIDATVGVVIGRMASRARQADALGYVGGYVIVSDLTLPHDSYYRPAIRQRCRDGFCPMSETIAPREFDLAAATVSILINGERVHERPMSRLVRSFPQLLEDVTEFMTLMTGDILLLGPPEAAPLARAGDEVRIDVAGLGELRHSLIAEESP